MTLCINESGTWRDATTVCVNQSGTWRQITDGCINQSGTWRKFGFEPTLGSAYEGGYLISQASNNRWIVAPSSSEVVRNWYGREDANTRAQQVSGCTGWFIPDVDQLQNPGYTCRVYWDSYQVARYWTCEVFTVICAKYVDFSNGHHNWQNRTHSYAYARAFRCVAY